MNRDSIWHDLQQCYHQASIRGLKHCAKWAAELLLSLSNSDLNQSANTTINGSKSPSGDTSFVVPHTPQEPDYLMAKACYDLFEYDRAAFFVKNSKSKECKFLYYYSRYMAADKKRLDLMAETNSSSSSPGATASTATMDISLNIFTELRNEVSTLYQCNELELDSYILYVYGIVLLKLDLNSEAINVLVKSVNADPLNWSAWSQLATVIDSKTQLDQLQLPAHWIRKLFFGAVYLELQMNEEALELYYDLLEVFKNSNYILSQLAIAKHNVRDVDGAIALFNEIRETDPCRLDSMDIFSNLLYVKDKRAELSSLAHAANNIEPFRVETCCCIANFYSLRGQHTKAVSYFARALQLNAKHLSAWTLMGHEYMEMKNTGAAIQAYRSAIKCNKRDYRAWYGLGQTYEILKMPSYCLYYYTIARSLRPNDPRMMIATGETLEKLDRNQDALKCYWKAGWSALTKLAGLYDKIGDKDKAAAAYNDYITKSSEFADEQAAVVNMSELQQAHKFMANYYFNRGDVTSAYKEAQTCMQWPETRDEARQIIKQIHAKTSVFDDIPVPTTI